jgi:predicted RNase H-like HicB family nuclease
MKFTVILHKTEEGFAVHCPALRGCWSQGRTEEEALTNIKDAIHLYLETLDELTAGQARHVVEVEVSA